VPVPLDLAGNEQIVADPWVLVPSLFGQAYIGGGTAAPHLGLTEQLFNETLLFTTRRFSKPPGNAQGALFSLPRTSPPPFFGLKTIWRGATKVSISDPARTLVDMISLPTVGGGIDHVTDCLNAYMSGKSANRDLIMDYAVRFENGVVFKRLGFLAEA